MAVMAVMAVVAITATWYLRDCYWRHCELTLSQRVEGTRSGKIAIVQDTPSTLQRINKLRTRKKTAGMPLENFRAKCRVLVIEASTATKQWRYYSVVICWI